MVNQATGQHTNTIKKAAQMSRFSVLKPPSLPTIVVMPEVTKAVDPSFSKTARQDRAGKKMVGGHFSADLSRAINILAAEQSTTVQALVGEALDLLMRHYGKHPLGER